MKSKEEILVQQSAPLNPGLQVQTPTLLSQYPFPQQLFGQLPESQREKVWRKPLKHGSTGLLAQQITPVVIFG